MVILDPLTVSVTVIEMMVTGSAKNPSKVGSATGFFFQHDERRYIVTNRHVVIDDAGKFYPDLLVLRVHTDPRILTQNRDIHVPLYSQGSPKWLEHPTLRSDVDVVAIEIGQLLQPHDVITFWNANLLLPTNVILGLAADAHVIGYPMGFYDAIHNLPIVRNGTLATPYGVPFAGKPLFLIDAELHPGTSGSPVVSPASSSRRTTEPLFSLGLFPPGLLGVNSGEFQVNGISLGLNAVWYPQLVLDIVTQKLTSSSSPTVSQSQQSQTAGS
jgi:S1-C subfamily serine protease